MKRSGRLREAGNAGEMLLRGWGWSQMGGYGMAGYGMGWTWIFWLFVIVAIVVLAVLIARAAGSRGAPRSPLPPAAAPETPEEIVKKRYARGEITREEYQKLLDDLRR